MKRTFFLIAALLGIVLAINSCNKIKEHELEIEIVNNSSSSIAGDIQYLPFEIAPGEVFTRRMFYASTLYKNPTPAQIGFAGPRELTVDGTSYAWKSGRSDDFFSYLGWDITPFGDGFICRLVLTDEAIADMLSHADPS